MSYLIKINKFLQISAAFYLLITFYLVLILISAGILTVIPIIVPIIYLFLYAIMLFVINFARKKVRILYFIAFLQSFPILTLSIIIFFLDISYKNIKIILLEF